MEGTDNKFFAKSSSSQCDKLCCSFIRTAWATRRAYSHEHTAHIKSTWRMDLSPAGHSFRLTYFMDVSIIERAELQLLVQYINQF